MGLPQSNNCGKFFLATYFIGKFMEMVYKKQNAGQKRTLHSHPINNGSSAEGDVWIVIFNIKLNICKTLSACLRGFYYVQMSFIKLIEIYCYK